MLLLLILVFYIYFFILIIITLIRYKKLSKTCSKYLQSAVNMWHC